MNFLTNNKIVSGLVYASGTATRNGDTMDMQKYDGILAIMTTATIAGSAVGDIHFETSTDSGFSGGADLAGSAIAVADDDDNQIFIIEVNKPLERYVRAVVTKNGAQAQAESLNYILYKGAKRPEVNDVVDLVTTNLLISPARGTK